MDDDIQAASATSESSPNDREDEEDEDEDPGGGTLKALNSVPLLSSEPKTQSMTPKSPVPSTPTQDLQSGWGDPSKNRPASPRTPQAATIRGILSSSPASKSDPFDQAKSLARTEGSKGHGAEQENVIRMARWWTKMHGKHSW